MNISQLHQKIKALFHRFYSSTLFVSEKELVTESYYYMRRNYIGQFMSAIIMCSVDIFWMIMNTINYNSRGLFFPLPLSGMIVHIIGCLLFALTPIIYKKTKSEKFMRIAVLIFYVATIYSVFTTSVAKNMMLAADGVNSENVGFSLVSLYMVLLCLLPVYHGLDAVICGLGVLGTCIVPAFLEGGESFNLPSNLLLCITIFLVYLFFRAGTSKNYKLENEIIKAKEDEETKHLAVINALGDDFTEILYLNLKTNQAKQFRCDESIEKAAYNENYSYEENLDMNIIPFVVPEETKRVREEFSISYMEKTLSTKNSFYVDFQMDTAEGLKYYQGKVVKDDASNDDIVIIGLRDVDEEVKQEKEYAETLRKARDDAEKASKAKSVFLFNMSHDIRTPMNAITGYIELAKKYKKDTTKLEDCLAKMEYSSGHLLHLINDVLDMARIESGKVQIDANPVDLLKYGAELTNMIISGAQQKNIEYTYEFKNINHKYLYLDALRVNQVVLNLASNATKYTKEGGKIHALIEELDSDKEGYTKIKFQLSDTGIGMSPQYLEHIFESFSRATDATHSGVQGTGLGMAITKNLVDLMGGTIDIQSELGVGTTVTILIDFKISDAIAEIVEDDNDEECALCGMKVLVVEDNDLNREIAKELLLDFGVEVSEANDGDVAVDMIKKSHKGDYDLVLMDIQMPMMDGYKATEAIRGLEGHEMANIPIVAMTANAFEEDRQNAFKAGMNGHLAKPIDIVKLKETLKLFYKK